MRNKDGVLSLHSKFHPAMEPARFCLYGINFCIPAANNGVKAVIIMLTESVGKEHNRAIAVLRWHYDRGHRVVTVRNLVNIIHGKIVDSTAGDRAH